MKGFVYNICLLFMLVPMLSLRAQAQTSYLDRIEWILSDVRMKTDSVSKERTARIDLALRWKQEPDVAPQHTVCITPVMLSKDSTREFSFAPIYIDGRIREKAIERNTVLDKKGVHRPDSAFVIETGRKAPKTVRYVAEIPYDPVMLDGLLALYETVNGCADCLKGTDTLYLEGVLLPYTPQWSAPGFMQSPNGDDKNRERHYTADLKFIVDRDEIDPDYMDNAEVLSSIMESIHTAMNDTVFAIKAVHFLGFASPDGPERPNTSLAERRAKSLADYIKGMDTSIPDSLYTVANGAENWGDFFQAVDADTTLAKNPAIMEVRKVLNETNRDSCEWILKGDKALYDRLRAEILPGLRRTDYVIEYHLRNFTPEEAEALWQEHPEWLSINEMYSVADLYGKDDPRYLDVLFTAARTYPADIAASHNAAIALYNAGMMTEAVSLLSGHYEPQLLNTLGIIYAGEGMYPEAEAALSLAANTGFEEAIHNLEELHKVMEQL